MRRTVAGISESVYEQLYRTGALAAIGEEYVFLAKPQLGRSVNRAIDAGQAFLEQVDRETQETANNKRKTEN